MGRRDRRDRRRKGAPAAHSSLPTLAPSFANCPRFRRIRASARGSGSSSTSVGDGASLDPRTMFGFRQAFALVMRSRSLAVALNAACRRGAVSGGGISGGSNSGGGNSGGDESIGGRGGGGTRACRAGGDFAIR